MRNFFSKLFKSAEERAEERAEELKSAQESVDELTEYINNMLLECVNNTKDNEFTVEIIDSKIEFNYKCSECFDCQDRVFNHDGKIIQEQLLSAFPDYIKNDKGIYYKVEYNGLYIGFNDFYFYFKYPYSISFTKIDYAI